MSALRSAPGAAVLALAASLGCLHGAACLPAEGPPPGADGRSDDDGGDGEGSDGGPGDAGVDPPVEPTVSRWIGINVSGDLPFVDIAVQLNRFDTAAEQKDADGYPLAGINGTSNTDIGFLLDGGDYAISYTGSGTLTVSGIGALAGTWQTAGDVHSNVLHITPTPGSFGNFLGLHITNGPGQQVRNIQVLSPGFSDAAAVFRPNFLALLKPFRSLRMMDWMATNNSSLVEWADRPRAAAFGASPFGIPYEHMVALTNATGKDLWVNIPERASDDYVAQLAAFLHSALDWNGIAARRTQAGFDAPFRLYVETSNETWNAGFTAFNSFKAIAQADTARFDGSYGGAYGPDWMPTVPDLMAVGQVEADRLARHGQVFRDTFAADGHSDAIAPVLAGWTLGAAYSDVGLRFIADHYGDPQDYVAFVAIAPYFGVDDAAPEAASLATLFPALSGSVAAYAPVFADFADLAAAYGIGIVAYEGGQSLTGSTNQNVKHLAQHDARMRAVYQDYLTLWTDAFGTSLFNHFGLAGAAGMPEFVYQYGYWGAVNGLDTDPDTCGDGIPTLSGTEDLASVVRFCPKYQALRERVPF